MKTDQNKIEVENIVVDVVRKDIKNLHLRVYRPTGRVRISAPLRINDETIRLFIVSKIGWIKKHQSKLEAHQPQGLNVNLFLVRAITIKAKAIYSTSFIMTPDQDWNCGIINLLTYI